ncbi:hypothetical protein F66182_319 [Fusarium sp. NRRL 66182]|nr:hypothetical protein F66182_319 [Fusarium sp. NRRL 66182]
MRRDSSARKATQNDDDDDDELASHPQEIFIRRDPDTQFAIKRANASHKLQATMAHIIEKYSRDFEGIGDEIDMATGEIVVNNGHLRSMRDEGDVEGLWVEGDSNIDEDEGILLEDLTDEYSDNEGRVREVRDSQGDDENSDRSSVRENDSNAPPEDDDTAKSKSSKTMPKTANDLNQNQDELPPSHLDHRHNREPDDDPRFESPPLGLGSSSFGYGPPPPGFGQWGMMPGITMQVWGRDDIPPYFNMLPSMPVPGFTGGRYDFPTNNGQTSIWGRKWVKRTKRAGSMKCSSKPAANTQLSEAVADRDLGVAKGDDSIHSDAQQTQSQKPQASDRTINATDEDYDLIFSGTTDPNPPTRSSPVPSRKKSPAKGKPREQEPENALKKAANNVVKSPYHYSEKYGSGRRRSGRVRKQTEYMGKISWDDAREWQNSGQTLSVELYRADPSVREDFQSVDSTDEERLPNQQRVQKNALIRKEAEAEEHFQTQVVPDSQDTATPFNSSAPCASQSMGNTNQTGTFDQISLPAMELSDDEAPLVLSRIKPRKRWIEPLSTAAQPQVSIQHQSLADDAVASVTSTPSTSTKKDTPRAKSKVAEVLDAALQSPKRKRGRPRTSTKISGVSPVATIIVAPNSNPEPQKRKRGRPRKSDVMGHHVQVEAQCERQKVVDANEFPLHGQVIEQGLEEEIQTREAPETAHHLSYELRWLYKTKPKDSVMHEAQDVDLDKRLRSRRSREMFQQTEDTTETPKKVAGRPQNTALEKQLKSPKPQEILQATGTGMEEPRKVSAEPVVFQDGLASSPEAVPASPSNSDVFNSDEPAGGNGSVDDEGPLDGNELPNTDEHLSNDNADGSPIDDNVPFNTPQDTTVQPVSTPRKPKDTTAHPTELLSSSHKPHTPRHTSIRTNRAPSSRRSLLSFVTDSDSDNDGQRDELIRRVKSASKTKSSRPVTHKIWRSTALTREVSRTPRRRRVQEMSSPTSTVQTPGGTLRTCGVDGYHCGRDYCFTCF